MAQRRLSVRVTPRAVARFSYPSPGKALTRILLGNPGIDVPWIPNSQLSPERKNAHYYVDKGVVGLIKDLVDQGRYASISHFLSCLAETPQAREYNDAARR